jgi:hypothetical protein
LASALIDSIHGGHYRQHAMAPALVVNGSGHRCQYTWRSACNGSGLSFLQQGAQPSVVHAFDG